VFVFNVLQHLRFYPEPFKKIDFLSMAVMDIPKDNAVMMYSGVGTTAKGGLVQGFGAALLFVLSVN